ncbi:hypothetical protein ACLI4Z_13960 [Natrialbaceae archaeon A-arb3/5]
MTFRVWDVVSEGVSLAASRNGAVLAGFFIAAETLGLFLFLVAGTMYVPVDVGTGLPSGSEVPTGELSEPAMGVATLLTGVFTSVVTIPISLVAIRTFVGGETNGIPDAFIFRRIGWATAAGVVASFAQSALLFAIPFGVLIGAIALVFVLSGTPLLIGWLVLLVLGLAAVVVVWLHFLFLLHEIGVRDRGVVGAFRGSWATVRGNRLKLALLAAGLALIRLSAGFGAVPPADGEWTIFELVTMPIWLLLSGIIGVFSAAIFARAYRTLRSDVDGARLRADFENDW